MSQAAAPNATPTPFADPLQTWNARFAQDGYVFGTEPNAWLRQNAGIWQPGAHVLCVADGEGRNSVWLARQGLQVDAFDISPVGVEKARRLAGQQVSVAYSVAGVEDFAWPQAHYDGVAAIFVQFADPALRARMFERIVACLKPGGSLLLLGYGPRQLEYRTGGPGQLAHLYTPELLRAELSGLEITDLQEFDAELSEGAGHSGRSALVALKGRRS